MKKIHRKICLATGSGALIGGLVMFVIFLAFFAFQKQSPTKLNTEKSASYFQLHYVGVNQQYARIPEKFCLFYSPDETANIDCMGQSLEINLKQDRLPVDRIHSAVTDLYNVVYETEGTSTTSIGCPFPDIFVYNLQTKQTRQLKNDPEMWVCGAKISYLSSLSYGGRYLIVATRGEAGGFRRWVYDIEQDRLDTDISDSPLFDIFSIGEDTARHDTYTVYLDGCSNYLRIGICAKEPELKLRNNDTGNVARLGSIEARLHDKRIDLRNIETIEYHMGTGELQISTGDIGGNVYVGDFKKFTILVD